jgi:hypothetical protein
MYEACLRLPNNPDEARLLADQLDALAQAMRNWSSDERNTFEAASSTEGLLERLVAHSASAARDPRSRRLAIQSAEASAAVLRVMWPDTQSPQRERALELAAH